MKGLDYNKLRKNQTPISDTQNSNIKNVTFKYHEPSESQLQLIERLKERLELNGHDTSFLVEATDRKTAWHVCNTLIRLCKKYNL